VADINALFPSKYLKAADIKGKGDPTVAIASVEIEMIGDDQNKPVLYFQGKEKGMVLNRTNADSITQLYGSDTDAWVGREIIIYVTRVKGPSGMTDGLRVRGPARDPGYRSSSGSTHGHALKPAAVPSGLPDDEIPF